MSVDSQEDVDTNLLNGWREIAAYLGRNQSTVRRWAAERHLPVHRPEHWEGARPPVFAYRAELDAWARGTTSTNEKTPSAAPAGSRTFRRRARTLSRPAVIAIFVMTCIAAGLIVNTQWKDKTFLSAISRHEAGVSEAIQNQYLQGIYHFNLRTADGLAQAIALFEDIREADPDFIDAQASLAHVYNLASQYGILPSEDAYEKARLIAEQALISDSKHPGALAALAFNTFYWQRDFHVAYDLFEKALKLAPEDGQIHHWYALATMHDRLFDISLREIQIAQRLSPESPGILANKALILHHAARSEDALAILEPLANSQPQLLSAASYLATIYLDTGRDDEFVDAYRRAAEIMNNDHRLEIAEAAEKGLKAGGREEMLQAMFDIQQQLHARGAEPAFHLARTASYLGDVDMAVDYLQAAVDRNEPAVLGIRLELARATMEAAPQYQNLVRQVGFLSEAE